METLKLRHWDHGAGVQTGRLKLTRKGPSRRGPGSPRTLTHTPALEVPGWPAKWWSSELAQYPARYQGREYEKDHICQLVGGLRQSLASYRQHGSVAELNVGDMPSVQVSAHGKKERRWQCFAMACENGLVWCVTEASLWIGLRAEMARGSVATQMAWDMTVVCILVGASLSS